VVKGNWDWQARKQTVWTNGHLPNKEAAMLYNSSARHKDRMHFYHSRTFIFSGCHKNCSLSYDSE